VTSTSAAYINNSALIIRCGDISAARGGRMRIICWYRAFTGDGTFIGVRTGAGDPLLLYALRNFLFLSAHRTRRRNDGAQRGDQRTGRVGRNILRKAAHRAASRRAAAVRWVMWLRRLALASPRCAPLRCARLLNVAAHINGKKQTRRRISWHGGVAWLAKKRRSSAGVGGGAGETMAASCGGSESSGILA